MFGARRGAWLAAVLLGPCVTAGCADTTGKFVFHRHYVDTAYGGNGRPGWVRAGDMDDDGDPDIVAGGGSALYVYENHANATSWTRHGNLDPTEGIGCNGAVLFDVDDDRDLDVVCGRYRNDLGWWENPGGALTEAPWDYHALASSSGWFLHDMVVADLDGDGRAEEFLFNLHEEPRVRLEWLRRGGVPDGPWERHIVEPGRNEGQIHYAGIDVADVDRDGDADIAYSNGWYESSGAPEEEWTWHEVTDIKGISNTLLRDMDLDGDPDLVMSAGHHGEGVFWFANPGDSGRGRWLEHEIDRTIRNPECLAVLDLDMDRDLDVVTCDLDFERWDREVHSVYVFENRGASTSWSRHRVAPGGYPSHLLQTVDLNRDGRADIISEATGYSVVTYYENATDLPEEP